MSAARDDGRDEPLRWTDTHHDHGRRIRVTTIMPARVARGDDRH